MAPRGRPKGSGSNRGETGGAVQSLDRALRLVAAIAESDGATLTAIAERVGLPPSTAHRLLATLAAHGFVETNDDDRTWAIGVEAFRVGQAFQRRSKPAAAARPVMRDLMEETGETANIGLFEGGDVVFIEQVESREPIRAFFRSGERRAAHASGIGKALLAAQAPDRVARWLRGRRLEAFTPATITDPARLLAALDEIRARGFALDDEERNPGMRCIAAAIYDEAGEAVAGLSISGPCQRIDAARLQALGPVVAAAAARVTRAIGGVVPRAAIDLPQRHAPSGLGEFLAIDRIECSDG